MTSLPPADVAFGGARREPAALCYPVGRRLRAPALPGRPPVPTQPSSVGGRPFLQQSLRVPSGECGTARRERFELLHSRATRSPVAFLILAGRRGGHPSMTNERLFILIVLGAAAIAMTLAIALLGFVGDGGA